MSSNFLRQKELSTEAIRRLSLLGLLIATVAWGASFFLAKQVIREAGVGPYLFWRFLLAPIFIIILFPRKLLGTTVNQAHGGFIIGLLLFVTLWTQSWGLQYTTAGRSGFITSLYVPFTPIFAWLLLRQTLLARQVLIALAAVAGLYIMTQPEGAGNPAEWMAGMNRGDLWTIATAAFGGAHIAMTEKISRGEPDSIALGLWQMMACAVFVVPTVAFQYFAADGATGHWHPLSWSSGAKFALVFNVLIVTCFGFIMQIVCQKTVSAFKAALIFALEAPFATLFGYSFLNEIMKPHEIAGAAIVFLTSIIPERWLKQERT